MLRDRTTVVLSFLSVCLSVCNVGYCVQTVGWIKIPFGTEVGLRRPGDSVLDGDPAIPWKGTQQPPHFSAYFALAWSPISAIAELLLDLVCDCDLLR